MAGISWADCNVMNLITLFRGRGRDLEGFAFSSLLKSLLFLNVTKVIVVYLPPVLEIIAHPDFISR